MQLSFLQSGGGKVKTICNPNSFSFSHYKSSLRSGSFWKDIFIKEMTVSPEPARRSLDM